MIVSDAFQTRVLKSSRIALHQQCENGNARSRHRQKPFRDSLENIIGAHVFTPLTELSNRCQTAPLVDAQQTEYLIDC
jgi:hypothetical protein